MDTKGYARILTKRKMGGICFIGARYQKQNIQLILNKKILENYNDIIGLTAGSIIYIDGFFTKSDTGTPSISTNIVEVVSPCQLPLPDKHKGLTSRSEYTNRSLGLISDINSFNLFTAIAEMNRRVRNIMEKDGYLEFNTGILQANFDSGLADSFTTKCNANGRIYHLSMTSEIKLKKLIAGGFDKVYEITQSFRNEGVNTTHYPEFGILEAYRTGDDLESCILTISMILKELALISRSITNVDALSDDFLMNPKKIPFVEALSTCGGHADCTLENLSEKFSDIFSNDMPLFTRIYKSLIKIIAPSLQAPTLIIDMPKGFNPFCRVINECSQQAVLIAKGMHIGTLSVDDNNIQTVREELQKQHKETGISINESYLELLALGIPPISGFGLGMTRLAMLLLPEDRINVRDVIPFPFI